MRAMGQNPTEVELQDIINELDENGDGSVDYGEFYKVMSKKIKNNDNPEEVEDAFKIISNGNDTLNIDHLKQVFQELGEILTENELKEMLSEVSLNGENSVSIEELKKYMLSN